MKTEQSKGRVGLLHKTPTLFVIAEILCGAGGLPACCGLDFSDRRAGGLQADRGQTQDFRLHWQRLYGPFEMWLPIIKAGMYRKGQTSYSCVATAAFRRRGWFGALKTIPSHRAVDPSPLIDIGLTGQRLPGKCWGNGGGGSSSMCTLLTLLKHGMMSLLTLGDQVCVPCMGSGWWATGGWNLRFRARVVIICWRLLRLMGVDSAL